MNRYLFYSLLLLGVGIRLVMLLNYELVNGGEVDVYLADEGVVGLMGKHILEGRDFPVFFYGQPYLGALEPYCVAASFALFGVGILPLRLVPFLFSLALGVAVYRFTYKTYSVAAARWATSLVAVSPMYFLQWNLKARGGFVEHLVLVFVLMLLFWRFLLEHDRGMKTSLTLGIVAGIALWVNQLVLAYLLLIGVLLLFQAGDRRGWKYLTVGLLLGSSLLLVYNVRYPLATFRTLARKAVVLNRVPIEKRHDHWLVRGLEKRLDAFGQSAGKLGIVFAVPPGSGVEFLGLSKAVRQGGPLTGARRKLWPIPCLVFGVALAACRPRRSARGWETLSSDKLLGLFTVATFLVGYVSPRYMLPAYPLAAVMAAVLASRLAGNRRRLMVVGLALVLAFNLTSWADAIDMLGLEEQVDGPRLLAFLDRHDLRYCYSAAPLYHLTFASGERVLLVPLQKDRYPAYNREIERASAICYVYRDDQENKRQHLALMGFLERHNLLYNRAKVGPYNVLYDFSPRRLLSGPVINRIRRQETARIEVGTILSGD